MKKTLLTVISIGSVAMAGAGATMASANSALATRPAMIRARNFTMPHKPAVDSEELGKLATLLKMPVADLQAALKAGTKLGDLATQHGVTQDQLNQFLAAEKQARTDALLAKLKVTLAQEVASGKITQAQMDARLAAVANHTALGPGHMGMAFGGPKLGTDQTAKLATLLNMTVTDLEAALKAGTKISDLAAKQGVTQTQLDAFNAAQKQARLDAWKQDLAAQVASGKITQTQMDARLAAMANFTNNEKNKRSIQKLKGAVRMFKNNSALTPATASATVSQ